MEEAPAHRVVVDLDCDRLNIAQTGKRCDYLFVGEEKGVAYVAPIELKSGGFVSSSVLDQLQGGADIVASWLPPDSAFRFVPILAHGKGVHREDLKTLRSARIKLREYESAPLLIRCGDPLKSALPRVRTSHGPQKIH